MFPSSTVVAIVALKYALGVVMGYLGFVYTERTLCNWLLPYFTGRIPEPGKNILLFITLVAAVTALWSVLMRYLWHLGIANQNPIGLEEVVYLSYRLSGAHPGFLTCNTNFLMNMAPWGFGLGFLTGLALAYPRLPKYWRALSVVAVVLGTANLFYIIAGPSLQDIGDTLLVFDSAFLFIPGLACGAAVFLIILKVFANFWSPRRAPNLVFIPCLILTILLLLKLSCVYGGAGAFVYPYRIIDITYFALLGTVLLVMTRYFVFLAQPFKLLAVNRSPAKSGITLKTAVLISVCAVFIALGTLAFENIQRRTTDYWKAFPVPGSPSLPVRKKRADLQPGDLLVRSLCFSYSKWDKLRENVLVASANERLVVAITAEETVECYIFSEIDGKRVSERSADFSEVISGRDPYRDDIEEECGPNIGKSAVDVAVGDDNVLVLLEDGTVWSVFVYDQEWWSYRIPGLDNIARVYASGEYCAAIRNDGALFTWEVPRLTGEDFDLIPKLIAKRDIASVSLSTGLLSRMYALDIYGRIFKKWAHSDEPWENTLMPLSSMVIQGEPFYTCIFDGKGRAYLPCNADNYQRPDFAFGATQAVYFGGTVFATDKSGNLWRGHRDGDWNIPGIRNVTSISASRNAICVIGEAE